MNTTEQTPEQPTANTFANTVRDDATTGTNKNKLDAQPGLANEDQPEWRPPEGEPEPRPPEPVMQSADLTDL